MEILKKSPKALPNEQKIIIMRKLIPVADKLFEKWTNGLDRSTQQATWNSVAEECEMEGICLGDGMALKNCVRNWIYRAQKILEKMDSCEQKTKLTHLQHLCIDLIYAAKGNDSIVSEVEFYDDNLPSTKHTIEPKFEDYSDESRKSKHTIEPQFEDYSDESRKSKLKQYNLLLQNIEMEQRLGLSQHEIFSLRQSISSSLCDLPSATSIKFESMTPEYLDETATK